MDAKQQILVEPGNPFGFDPAEFADLVQGISEELGREYDVRVAYREQVGAGVTLYEVVNVWLSWQNWSEGAQGALVGIILEKILEWRRRRREANPAAFARPIWARVIVTLREAQVVGEVRIGGSDGEPEYGPFSDSDEDPKRLQKEIPPIRPWPPRQEDLPQRSGRELARRRIMLEAIHAMVVEAQERGHDAVIVDSPTVTGLGRQIQLDAAESRGLFKRLVEEGYIRLRRPLQADTSSEDLRAEVEYLTDRGLEEIGEI
jgi:hypothetical protein